MMNALRSLFVGLLALAATGGGVHAQVMPVGGIPALDGEEGQGPLPNRLASEVGLTEHIGSKVSLDLMFSDERGQPARLGSLFTNERPVLLVFVYHSCPMLCSLVLDGVADAVKGIDLPVGEQYSVLAVSIDERDTPARADSAKARYIQRIDQPNAAAGVHFWTVTPETAPNVKRLADEVGFRYAFDARTGDFAHTAAVMVLSPTGMISRYLYGIDYAPRDVRLALVDAGDGKTGTAFDRFLLTCYHYDANAQGYSLQILSVLKYLGGGMLLLLAFIVGPLWLREARRQRADLALDDDLDPTHALTR